MSRIIIKNIGPIKEAQFDINGVNLFIGPQSSGKSTIVKLVSFCQWLEKYIIINQGAETINNEFMQSQLVSFHRFENYFTTDSFLAYYSDIFDLEYFNNRQPFSLNVRESVVNGKMSKVAYVPSERNILGLPNIATMQMGDTYIRSFVFDWLNMRSKYGLSKPYSVLDLGAEYYFDEKKGDIVSLEKGKLFPLSDASSGLQSLIPLLVYVDYITKWIYENVTDTSYFRQDALNKTLAMLSRRDGIMKASDFFELVERISHPHNTKLIIEECEMNIFPSTQYALVKSIVASMNLERGDSLFLTTHSPYVMTSINNLIQAGNTVREDPSRSEDIKKVIPSECWLDYDKVSAWAVEDGRIRSIKDNEYKLISAEALDGASDEIAKDFSRLS